MVTRYAANTSVSVEKSKAEIEQLLQRYGASQFASGWDGATAMVGFRLADRTIRFLVPLPDPNAREFCRTPGKNLQRSEDSRMQAWEQACRSRWRALLLVIKAKLEAVQVGISTIEDEFLAWTVIPGDSQTVGERLRPQLAAALASGRSAPLLLTGGAG